MCGFLGIANKEYFLEKENKVMKGFEWLKHRGPDESTFHILENFFIGFHRLSIVGLNNKRASQPFFWNDKRSLMFNGEIYNFKKLSEEKFSHKEINPEDKSSDTFILSKLIQKYGYKCLNWIDGMFSIAIVNDKTSEITLIRDRYGIKPLYYFLDDGNIIFCSHIKPILDISGKKNINQNAIYTYLKTGLYDHSDETFFKDIKSVPPGTIFQYNTKTFEQTTFRWYEIEKYLNSENFIKKSEVIDEINLVLDDVIKDYIPREVEFGLNISGGVDSTILINKIKKFYNKELFLLNQDYEHPYSERPWINTYSEKLDLRPNFFLITPEEIKKDLRETFNYQMQPFGGLTVPGYTPLYQKANKKKCKVLIDGTGLDEAFLGYKRYYPEILLENKNTSMKSLGYNSGPTDLRGIRPNAISDKLKTNAKLLDSYFSNLEGKIDCDESRLKSIQDLVAYKIPRTTRFTDHVSSRFSTELRVPFLSHKLMHLGFRIPSKFLLTNEGTKFPIRQILNDNGLGKVGFAPKRYVQSPQNIWLTKELKFLVDDFVLSDSFFDRGWIKPSVVKEEIMKYKNSEKLNSFFIWQWFSLEFWARCNFDS